MNISLSYLRSHQVLSRKPIYSISLGPSTPLSTKMRSALIFSTLASLALSTPAPYCPVRRVIDDGGFESGVTPSASTPNPWKVDSFIGASTYELTSPGSTNAGGKYAFTSILFPGPFTDGASGETLKQTMHTCIGQNYSILADFKFESAANGNCAISIRYPFKDTTGSVTTGSATPGLTPGVWSTTGSFFQAVSSADPFSIVFSCSNGEHNRISVDNVKIQPFAGNAF